MIRSSVRVLLLSLLALALFESTADAQSRQRRDPNRITTEEIEGVTAQNVQDLIQRLRPSWLRIRGTTSMQMRPIESPTGGMMDAPAPQQIMVYLDGARVGPHSNLRSIPVENVVQIEFMDGPSATNRFGTGHPYGAILVSTRK